MPAVPIEIAGVRVLEADTIASRVSELGSQISRDHEGSRLSLITVLKGGLFFLADLCRAIDLDLTLDFMAVSSYAGGAPGSARITKDLDDSIEGATVILVEDIIDTGLTLNYVVRNLLSRRPASLEICTLLDKDVRRIVDLPTTYRGFEVPDRFLVGYGLDYRGRYRNVPYISELRDEAMTR
jgi:hypoxanthine phosphoribosyltransferase